IPRRLPRTGGHQHPRRRPPLLRPERGVRARPRGARRLPGRRVRPGGRRGGADRELDRGRGEPHAGRPDRLRAPDLRRDLARDPPLPPLPGARAGRGQARGLPSPGARPVPGVARPAPPPRRGRRGGVDRAGRRAGDGGRVDRRGRERAGRAALRAAGPARADRGPREQRDPVRRRRPPRRGPQGQRQDLGPVLDPRRGRDAPPHPRAVRRRAAEPDQDRVAADPAAAVGVRLLRRLRGPPGRPAHPGRPGGGPRALHVPEGPGIVSRGGVSGRTMPTTWERLANDSILDLRPYEPGKPTGEVERELGVAGAVKLASNENPFPPTAAVREALQAALDGLNRYPDGSARALRQALAKKHDVPADGIVVGNGSNELIELVARTFVRAGEEVVLPHPSFIVYPSIVQSVGGIRVVVPLREHRLDLAAMARAITPLTKLVFVANPNN